MQRMVILLASFVLAHAAQGSTPEAPLDLRIGDSVIVFLSSEDDAWIRATTPEPPTDTHVLFSVSGATDIRLRLYATLENAIAGVALAEDDTGSLDYPLGLPSFYLEAMVLDGSAQTVEIDSATESHAVDRCPWTGSCVAVEVARNQPSGAGFLKTARDFRDEVLLATPRGPAIAKLHYDLSRELVPSVLLKPTLAAQLFRIGRDLMPTIEAAVSIVRGLESDSVIPAETFAAGTELCDLLGSLSLSSKVMQQIEQLCANALELDRHSLRDAMRTLDLLPSNDKVVVVKFAHGVRAPRLEGGALAFGRFAVDALFNRFHVTAARAVFPGATGRGMDRVFAISLSPETTTSDLLTSLSGSQFVEWSEPERRLRILSEDLYYPDQWGLRRVGAEMVWPETMGFAAVVVAVVDTGIDLRHADLLGVSIVNARNIVDNNNDPLDGHGHGTHVAGIIAALLNNGYGIAGIAPGVTIMPIKVLDDSGSGTSTDVAAGIRYAADNGAKLMNMSLGGPQTDVVEEAVRYAKEKGVLILAAAGNDAEEELLHPASSTHTMAISACDENDELATFSNFGEGIDLCAPGVDIVSTFKECFTCLGSGTSMATPHVTGVAALILSQFPHYSVEDLKDHLISTSRDLGEPGWDPKFGHGLVNASPGQTQSAEIFSDGFESGTLSAWSSSAP